MSQHDILEHACTSSASLSEVLAKLESEGLITRTKSTEDRRLFAVVLTAAGRAKAEEFFADRARFEEDSFACHVGQNRQKAPAPRQDRSAHACPCGPFCETRLLGWSR